MGFSACFGGPMLNMLLGVGFSGSYIIMQTQQPYRLDFSRTLIISSMQLLLILALSAITIPLNRYHLSRQWGMMLIAVYVIVMIVNVMVELHWL
jgi:solute carrier family 24 (sodium/potassium/calcium exchanger), member 6